MLACGAVSERELFSESTAALAEHLGESCEATPVPQKGVVVVEDRHPACLPGQCVIHGSQPGAELGQGICTCRCKGPAGTGPFCSCGDGFVCKHLVDDLGIGQAELTRAHRVVLHARKLTLGSEYSSGIPPGPARHALPSPLDSQRFAGRSLLPVGREPIVQVGTGGGVCAAPVSRRVAG